MPAALLKILFDKEDHIYCANEEVSGKVVVEAATDLNCREFLISYGWRTHGMGNMNKGGEEALNLANEVIKFHKGERWKFPFVFNAPTDPLTYHGHYVNVDWYLKASMKNQRAADIHAEEDFLVISREYPQNDRSGEPLLTGTNRSYPTRSPSYFIERLVLWLGIIVIGGLILLWLVMSRQGIVTYIVVLIFALFLIVVTNRKKILNLAFKQKIDIQEVQVKPPYVYPGDQMTCDIKFQTKGSVSLDHIAATLLAAEYAVSGGGSRTQSYSFTIHNKQVIKPYSEELAAGRWVTYKCPLPIPNDAPPTFIAAHNRITWSLNLKIILKRWPSWEETIPIIVSSR